MLQFSEVDFEEFWNMENPSLSEQTSILDIMSMKLDGLFNIGSNGGETIDDRRNVNSSGGMMVHGPAISIPKWNSTSSLLSSTSSACSSSVPSPSYRTNKHAMIACAVCGDKSSGKHYGVFTCEGCKSFFKRSIRKSLEYLCRANKKCPVDQHHRNQCQHCRLKKCFKVGMKKEAVQSGRHKVQQTNTTPINPYSSTFLSQIIAAEPFQPIPTTNMNFLNDDNQNICELATKLLFNAIEWAKNIPFFSSLTTASQIALVKLAWKELFILNLGKCQSPLRLNEFMNNSGMETLPEYQTTFCEHVKSLQMQIDTLKSLQIDTAEYACLKAMILFTPDTPGLSNPGHIHILQEKAMNALESYTKTKYPQQPARFGQLLLRLSSIRTINTIVIEQLFFTWLVGKTPIETIIQDYMFGTSGYQWAV